MDVKVLLMDVKIIKEDVKIIKERCGNTLLENVKILLEEVE
jgi:hypothetical protein